MTSSYQGSLNSVHAEVLWHGGLALKKLLVLTIAGGWANLHSNDRAFAFHVCLSAKVCSQACTINRLTQSWLFPNIFNFTSWFSNERPHFRPQLRGSKRRTRSNSLQSVTSFDLDRSGPDHTALPGT